MLKDHIISLCEKTPRNKIGLFVDKDEQEALKELLNDIGLSQKIRSMCNYYGVFIQHYGKKGLCLTHHYGHRGDYDNPFELMRGYCNRKNYDLYRLSDIMGGQPLIEINKKYEI